MNKFAEKLRELRDEKDFSQKELAEALSVERYYISNLEQGRTEPDLDSLIKIAKYFGVSTDYILGLDD